MTFFENIKVLTKQQMFNIHSTVLRVLSEVGLEIHISTKAFSRLRECGLRVDEENRLVWLDEEPVLETIQQLSEARLPKVTVDGTDKDPLPHRLPAKLIFGIGANHGFVQEGTLMRPALRKDIINCVRLQKYLLGKASSSGLLSDDVPGEVKYIHTAAFNVKYCENPSAPDCNEPRDAAWITRIMRAAGVWDETQEHRGSVYARSPLCLIGRGAEFLERAANTGHHMQATGMPASAATAPGTVAGYLVQYLAESLGFTTIGRLIANPPNNRVRPFANMGDDVTALDVRKGIYFLAGPEISLMRMAMKQICGEFYKFKGSHCCGIRTFTDAKVPGIQAAMEKTLQAMSDLMAGMYSDEAEPTAYLNCAGSLNSNLSLSLEQAVIDYELFKSLNRLLEGINVNKESLGFDAIKRVGPSGEFLSDEHTIRHMKSEWWFPELFHRGAWDDWEAHGRPNVLQRAEEVVQESKKVDVPCVLPSDIAREIDRLIQAAERDLLGSATGILP